MLQNIRRGFPNEAPFFTFTVDMTITAPGGGAYHFAIGDKHKVKYQGNNSWQFQELPGQPVLMFTDWNLLGVEPTA